MLNTSDQLIMKYQCFQEWFMTGQNSRIPLAFFFFPLLLIKENTSNPVAFEINFPCQNIILDIICEEILASHTCCK